MVGEAVECLRVGSGCARGEKSGTAFGLIVMMLSLHCDLSAIQPASCEGACSVAETHHDTEAQTTIDLVLVVPLISPLTLPLT